MGGSSIEESSYSSGLRPRHDAWCIFVATNIYSLISFPQEDIIAVTEPYLKPWLIHGSLQKSEAPKPDPKIFQYTSLQGLLKRGVLKFRHPLPISSGIWRSGGCSPCAVVLGSSGGQLEIQWELSKIRGRVQSQNRRVLLQGHPQTGPQRIETTIFTPTPPLGPGIHELRDCNYPEVDRIRSL